MASTSAAVPPPPRRTGHPGRGAVTSDDGAVCELEVTLASAPHHEAIVIDRSQPGDHCQMTLERWLPISDDPGIQDAVTTIQALLSASTSTDPARTTGTTAAP